MARNTLELAHDGLFIEKIKSGFQAAEAGLLTKAHAFSREKATSAGSLSFRVAELIRDQGVDAVTIAAALLAPTLWHGCAELAEIKQHFGQAVAGTLRDFKSPLVLRTDTEPHRREDIHVLLGSLAGNPRKALLFIAFRLIELESAFETHGADVRSMAQETLDFYVPIANRLGLGELCRRLEDACFHILNPDDYETLEQQVAHIRAEDDKCLQILMEGVKRLLTKNDIQASIQGRAKSLYSIYGKMSRTGNPLDEIMDRIGLRIIVLSVPECYTVLGLLHTHFKPIPGTFDDYIGLPKDNGYQSLHTCVYPVREISHKPIEFQVRTELMHMEAEHGRAAHWRYKTESASNGHPQGQWINGLVHQHGRAENARAFIQLLHRQVYEDHLVVFGKGGRIMRLPDNATVRDYMNQSNIHFPQGAVVKVNGEIVDIDRNLRDGDSIEVVEHEPHVSASLPMANIKT